MRIFGEISILALCLAATMAVPTPNDNKAALRAVTSGAGQFSTALYKAIAETEQGNVILSPISAGLVLSMAAYGAGQNTATQMRNALHMPADDNLGKAGFSSLIDTFNAVKDVDLRLANKIFTNSGFSVKPDFQKVTEDAFRSTSEQINFSQQSAAANTINKWAMDHTNNKIKDLVKADDFDASTMMVLLNAVYFKGSWQVKFNPEDTMPMPFHVDANTVKNVPTMFRKGEFKYGDLPELEAKYIFLSYKGGNVSMFIILPNEKNGLAKVEKNLDKVNVQELYDNTYPREVNLYLPKFKIESKFDLEAPLKKLGMGEMFSDNANFSGISDVPLKVGKVMQKAYIEVNEEGSEAAAVTGMQVVTRCMTIVGEVLVDRPFLYSIVKLTQDEGKESSDVLSLFSGRVTDPQPEDKNSQDANLVE